MAHRPPAPTPLAVVAMSRARLGLYVFGRASLFANCYELQPTFQQLLARPHQLALVPGEHYGACERAPDAVPPAQLVSGLQHMAGIVQHMAQQWEAAASAWARQQAGQQEAAAAAAGAVEAAVQATAPPPEEAQQGGEEAVEGDEDGGEEEEAAEGEEGGEEGGEDEEEAGEDDEGSSGEDGDGSEQPGGDAMQE